MAKVPGALPGPGDGLAGAEADGAVDLFLEVLGDVIDEDDGDVIGAELEDFGGGHFAFGVAFAHVRVDDDFHSDTSGATKEWAGAPGAARGRIQVYRSVGEEGEG